LKNFALYEKLCDLADWLFPVVDKWPKAEKFALCTQVKNCVHDMVKLAIRAQKSREKVRWLYELDVQLQMLRHFLRHAHGRRYLSNRKLRLVTEMLSEIGRITGGLIKRFQGQGQRRQLG
jgi:hypothetical protein